MIANEITELAKDLAETKLSPAAKRYISGRLKKEGAQSVNIQIEASTADALNDVVQKHNLVRDAFLCRLIIFLRGSEALLKYLEVPTEINEKMLGEGFVPMPTSPLGAMKAVRDDPLFYIREHLRDNWGCGVYTVPLPNPSYHWAACYLEDKDVPGTKAHKEEQQKYAEMFDEEEQLAFGAASLVKKGA